MDTVSNHLLDKFHNSLPFYPYCGEDRKKFASTIGFVNGSIEFDEIQKAYHENRILFPSPLTENKSEFARIGKEYVAHLFSQESFVFFERYYNHELGEADNLDFLIKPLDKLILDSGWSLDLGGGFYLNMYVRPSETPHIPVLPDYYDDNIGHVIPYSRIPEEQRVNPFSHIHLSFTPESLWQAYLLFITDTMVGMFDHGLYYEKRLVMNYSDLSKDLQGRFSFSLPEKQNPIMRFLLGDTLYPSVIIESNYALISHYWINDWVGLYQTHVIVKYNEAHQQIESWHRIDEDALINFDCGDRI